MQRIAIRQTCKPEAIGCDGNWKRVDSSEVTNIKRQFHEMGRRLEKVVGRYRNCVCDSPIYVGRFSTLQLEQTGFICVRFQLCFDCLHSTSYMTNERKIFNRPTHFFLCSFLDRFKKVNYLLGT